MYRKEGRCGNRSSSLAGNWILIREETVEAYRSAEDFYCYSTVDLVAGSIPTHLPFLDQIVSGYAMSLNIT